jgi:hypothetical protein
VSPHNSVTSINAKERKDMKLIVLLLSPVSVTRSAQWLKIPACARPSSVMSHHLPTWKRKQIQFPKLCVVLRYQTFLQRTETEKYQIRRLKFANKLGKCIPSFALTIPHEWVHLGDICWCSLSSDCLDREKFLFCSAISMAFSTNSQ